LNWFRNKINGVFSFDSSSKRLLVRSDVLTSVTIFRNTVACNPEKLLILEQRIFSTFRVERHVNGVLNKTKDANKKSDFPPKRR
jgi:hypothetical protein